MEWGYIKQKYYNYSLIYKIVKNIHTGNRWLEFNSKIYIEHTQLSSGWSSYGQSHLTIK